MYLHHTHIYSLAYTHTGRDVDESRANQAVIPLHCCGFLSCPYSPPQYDKHLLNSWCLRGGTRSVHVKVISVSHTLSLLFSLRPPPPLLTLIWGYRLAWQETSACRPDLIPTTGHSPDWPEHRSLTVLIVSHWLSPGCPWRLLGLIGCEGFWGCAGPCRGALQVMFVLEVFRAPGFI